MMILRNGDYAIRLSCFDGGDILLEHLGSVSKREALAETETYKVIEGEHHEGNIYLAQWDGENWDAIVA